MHPPGVLDASSWLEWENKIDAERRTCLGVSGKIAKDMQQKGREASTRHMQRAYADNPKQWNKKILKASGDSARLMAVKDKDTGNVINDPAAIIDCVHKFYQRQAEPVLGPKTGSYLPEEAPRAYPWMNGEDSYTLETFADKPTHGTKFCMLDHLRDPALYQQHVHKLPNRKSPGPDGIQNQLLKHLPEELHQAIHKMFIRMWMTGHTPTAWKESCTILIHKKGDEQDLANWRPIALAYTLYQALDGCCKRLSS